MNKNFYIGIPIFFIIPILFIFNTLIIKKFMNTNNIIPLYSTFFILVYIFFQIMPQRNYINSIIETIITTIAYIFISFSGIILSIPIILQHFIGTSISYISYIFLNM